MLVNITVSEKKQVNIREDELLAILRKFIQDKMDIREGSFINDKNELVYKYEDGCGTHSWFEENKLRDATDIDKAVFSLLKQLSA